MPIAQRGHVIGLLGVQAREDDPSLTEGQISMVQTISEQMELILDNARLFEEARLRAGQERQVREIASRVRESLDIDTVLQAVVREIGEALNLAEAEVRMGAPGGGELNRLATAGAKAGNSISGDEEGRS